MVRKYLAPLSVVMRWGHLTTPVWVIGNVVNNPSANTSLVTYTIPSNKVGYIYGLYISTPEANDFVLEWRNNNTTQTYYIYFNSKGTLYFADLIPLNEGLPADPNSVISIKNINSGNGNYHSGLLIGVV